MSSSRRSGGWLAAYDAATGKPRWFGPKSGAGYSSPQLTTIDGVTQVVLLSGNGAISVAPADGTMLWQHTWPSDGDRAAGGGAGRAC